jgi:predicted DsbA family dithiol-disulfide isomerase
MGRQAARAGVTGIPTFDVGTERVVGAQPYEVLAAAVGPRSR